jgi:hypothetical protein
LWWVSLHGLDEMVLQGRKYFALAAVFYLACAGF